MLIGPLRMVLFVTIVLSCSTAANFLMIGGNANKVLPAWRNFLLFRIFRIFTTTTIWASNSWIWREEKEYDYTYYLGPDWKKELKAYDKKIPTIIHNHGNGNEIATIAHLKLGAFLAVS